MYLKMGEDSTGPVLQVEPDAGGVYIRMIGARTRNGGATLTSQQVRQLMKALKDGLKESKKYD